MHSHYVEIFFLIILQSRSQDFTRQFKTLLPPLTFIHTIVIFSQRVEDSRNKDSCRAESSVHQDAEDEVQLVGKVIGMVRDFDDDLKLEQQLANMQIEP